MMKRVRDVARRGRARWRDAARLLSSLGEALRTGGRRQAHTAARQLRANLTVDERTAAYRRWAHRHAPDAAALAAMAEEAGRFPYRPLISLITPVYNTDPRWLRECIASVRAQAYTNWELCLCDDGSTSQATVAVLREQTDPRIRVTYLERNSRISAASNAALGLARGQFVALLDHDDELTPDALYEVVRHLNTSGDADVVYSDEDKRDADGALSEPYFKPDWSPEHLLSAMYTCHLTVARKSLVDRVGGFRVGYEGAQDHDLMLRLCEHTTRIDHVAKVLYHWRRTPESTATAGSAKPWADDSGRRALEDHVRRNAQNAEVVSGGVPGLYRVRFAIRGEPLVTIVVAVGEGAPDAVEAAVAAVRGRTAYSRYEIVPVPAAAHRGQTPAGGMTGPINAAVRASAGAHLVVLDAALRPVDDGWLTALLEYSQQDGIGAVGARIEYADGRLRHIGLVTCIEGGPASPFHGHAGDSYGYFSSAIGVRNAGAVSGECLMTRREIFDRVGGFHERLPWRGADVDYCLRVRRAGYRIVFTPYTRLQGATALAPPGFDDDTMARLRTEWPADIERDPHYNPNLSRRSADYLLE